MSDRRALIVAAASAQLLRSIDERPDLVIAADSGVHAVLARGWMPDVVVGDLDSARPDAVEAAADGGARIERAAVDKDETDLELALGEAIAAGVTDAVVIVRSDGRLDHQLANLMVLASPAYASMDVAAVVGEHRVWAVRGARTLDLTPGDHLALMPIGGPAVVTSRGVAFPLTEERLSPFAGRGIANEVAAEQVELHVHDGVVLAVSSPRWSGDPDVAPGSA